MTEQTAEPTVTTKAPTSRRRRLAKRLLTLICVVGFLYGVAKWLSRPSDLDQRLVGKWEFTEKGPLAAR